MPRAQFFTTTSLGPRRAMTPEGFLVCYDVAIARTGEMEYHEDELRGEDGNSIVTPGDDGIIRISRNPEEVFRPETIASFNGKSVTNEHPDGVFVSPENWKELTVGTIQNPRQGEGQFDDLLLADLIITDPETIKDVNDGKREVSCGYMADYEETGKGTGAQKNILGNHVALVEQGRCGWRCAIGDSKYQPKEKPIMATKGKFAQWLDRLGKAIKSKDDDAVNELMQNPPAEAKVEDDDNETGGDTHIHVHTGPHGESTSELGGGATGPDAGRVRFTDDDIEEHMGQNAAEHAQFRKELDMIKQHLGITDDAAGEGEMAEELGEEAPAGASAEVKDKARRATDSAYLGESYQNTVALAEILVPGIRVPTFDRAAKPSKSFKDICGIRRAALDMGYTQPKIRMFIDSVMGNQALDTKSMSCSKVRTVFNAVGALAKTANNTTATVDGVRQQPSDTRQVKSLKDLNKYWDDQIKKD